MAVQCTRKSSTSGWRLSYCKKSKLGDLKVIWYCKSRKVIKVILINISREDSEMGMFTMLKEVVVRVKSELEEER